MKEKGLFSIVLLSYYSKERILKCYDKLSVLFEKEKIPFELIVMDDGSKDESYEIALSLENKVDNVYAYQLSRNYGSFYSMMAAFTKVNGACCCYIPDDEQQPYTSIVEMYRMWQAGNKVVVANRISRNDPFLSRLSSNLFYGIINKLSDELRYPEGGTDNILIDREVIDIINQRIHPINTNVIAEILRLGFSPVLCPYERPLGLNRGKSRWTFRKRMRLAKDVFFSSSSFPIKMITRMGILFSLLSIVGILFYIYIFLFGNKQFWGVFVPGWTSIIVLVSFFSGSILFSLGMIAEYVWRIYDEVKARPGFIIKKK